MVRNDDITVTIGSQFNARGFKQLEVVMHRMKSSVENFSRSFKQNQDRISSVMKDAARPLVESMSGLRDTTLAGVGQGVADNVLQKQKELADFSQSFAKKYEQAGLSVNKLNNNLERQAPALKRTASLMGRARIAVHGFTKKLQAMQGQILGAGLGVMFFGMAIQRAFMGIWRSAQRTFTEVVAQTDNADNGFTRLQGSMKYLWFTVGQALEPLAYALIPIIDRISEWVTMNPELTRQIVAWGIALGTVMFFFGQLGLGINGVVQAIGLLKPLLAPLGTLLLSIGKVALTIGKYLLWAFKNPMATLKILGGVLKTVFLSPVGWVILLVAGVVAAVTWIVKMSKEMGGFGEFAKSVLRGVLRFIFLLGEGFIWLGNKIWEVLVIGLEYSVNGAIGILNNLIAAINLIPGVNIGEIGPVSFGENQYQFGDGILANYLDWEAEKLGPKNGYATGKEGDPAYSAPKNQISISNLTVQSDNPDQLMQELQRYGQ